MRRTRAAHAEEPKETSREEPGPMARPTYKAPWFFEATLKQELYRRRARRGRVSGVLRGLAKFLVPGTLAVVLLIAAFGTFSGAEGTDVPLRDSSAGSVDDDRIGENEKPGPSSSLDPDPNVNSRAIEASRRARGVRSESEKPASGPGSKLAFAESDHPETQVPQERPNKSGDVISVSVDSLHRSFPLELELKQIPLVRQDDHIEHPDSSKRAVERSEIR